MSNKCFLLILTIIITFSATTFAQMMIPAPLVQRVNNAQKVAIGRIINKHSYWDAEHHNIWTINLMEVQVYFKNDAPDFTERIAIITSGGIVGNEGQTTCPSYEFSINQECAVFLDADNRKMDDRAFRQSYPTIPQCEPYASSQGVLGYHDGLYRDLMVERPMSESDLVKRLKTEFNLSPIVSNGKLFTPRETPQYSALLGSITGWANGGGTSGTSGNYIGATIVANNELIITGTGFGATAGTVEFDHSDDGITIGSAGYATTLPSDIVSWSDVQIRTKIPSKAGTGLFRVKDNGGTVVATSASNINIIWSQINVEQTYLNFATATRQQVKFINQDGASGYTFKYSTVTAGGNTFSTNAAAKASFERALISWRCATQVNFKISAATTSVGPVDDDINSVSFNPALAANVLGSCITRFSAQGVGGTCDFHNTLWYVKELDVQMSPDAATFGWNYGTGATSGNQIDFESVMLHELGHGHSCDHINNSVLTMNWAISANSDKRTLTTNEIACGDFRVSNSTSAFCVSSFGGGKQPMARISLAGCAVLPIELLRFKAVANGEKSAQITWQTASEDDMSKFQLQVSKDGKNYQTLTEESPKGSKEKGADYAYEHTTPFSGINYYRLVEKKWDDATTVLANASVEFKDKSYFKLVPNPTQGVFTLNFYADRSEATNMQVFDVLGRIVATPQYQSQIGENTITIHLSNDLADGIYLVTMNQNGAVKSAMIKKQE